MWRKIPLLIVLVSFVAWAAADTSLPIRVVNPKALPGWTIPAERIAIGPGYKPCLALLPDGELVMVALFNDRSGGKFREWTGLWRSSDGGKTWSERVEITDMIGREQYLTCTSDGTLFATCHLLPQDVNNKDGYTHSYVHRSTDEGRTWERTRIAAEGMRLTHSSRNVVEMPDGTLLLGAGISGLPGRTALFLVSKDHGKSWQAGEVVKLGKYQGKEYSNWDAFFSEDFTYLAKSGKLLHWIRCGPPSPMHPMNDGRPVVTGDDSVDRTMWCESTDGGMTWSDVGDFGDYARMYPRALRLADGRLLMTYTQRGVIYPIGLRAQLSYDDGDTWDFEFDQIVIEGKTPWGAAQGGGFGNTLQLADGTLVSCYSYRGTDNGTHIEVVRWRLPAAKAKE